MHFVDNHPLYRITRITGPQHNLLGLQLANDPPASGPEVEALDRGSREPGSLDGREVASCVMLGVEQASSELHRAYFVEKIQYVLTDSPPAAIYRQLAIEIIRRVDASRSR